MVGTSVLPVLDVLTDHPDVLIPIRSWNDAIRGSATGEDAVRR